MSSAGVLPLEGIDVLELSTFISASFSSTLLGDFGATVTKVELPGAGDPQRALGIVDDADPDRSLWFLTLGRNKRSVALDLRQPEARLVVERLVRRSRVVIENFRPGTLEAWGIGPDWIAEVNPDAIVLRVSGFGQTGPDRSRPSFERVAQAFGGLMYVTGDPDAPPQRAGLPVVDYSTGLWGAIGVLLALVAQLRHDGVHGQVIDHAIYESIIPFTRDMSSNYARTADVPERTGNKSANAAPGEAYRTRDGRWIFIAVTGDVMFKRAMTAIGRDDLLTDPRFATNGSRLKHRSTLDDAMSEWASAREATDVIATMDAHDVPVTPVHSIADLMAHPQVQAREDFVHIHDPVIGDVVTPNVFPRLSATPGSIRRMAPVIGQHTDEVLRELGFGDSEIGDLRAAGVVG